MEIILSMKTTQEIRDLIASVGPEAAAAISILDAAFDAMKPSLNSEPRIPTPEELDRQLGILQERVEGMRKSKEDFDSLLADAKYESAAIDSALTLLTDPEASKATHNNPAID